MLYVSYHGGSKGVSNADLVDENGTVTEDVLDDSKLPKGVSLDELRALAWGPDGNLWVVSGAKSTSQVLRFEGSATNDVHAFVDMVADTAALDGILHPFDLAFPPGSQEWFVSSQDTNVVTGPLPESLPDPPYTPPAAPYLTATYTGGSFLAGTFVASAVTGLEKHGTPVVPAPQGLQIETASARLHHSVRGLAHDGERLYVADEAADAVKAYDATTGELVAQYPDPADAKKVKAPVHLLLEADGKHLLVGSSGNGKVVRVKLSTGDHKHVADVNSVSGLAIDSQGTLYAADRTAKQIWSGPLGQKLSKYGPTLRDEPELILLPPGA